MRTCNIGLSSMALWLYLDGNMDNPIRARSDAECNVFYGDIKKIEKNGEYYGEKFRTEPENYLEYSQNHVIKVRSGWDGYSDAYGEIKIKEGIIYVLHTKPVDHSDPRYIDYLKTTDNPTWIGYETYCGDLYEKELNEALSKHAKRNEEYLNEINHLDTFIWLQNYIKNKPKSMGRDEAGAEVFDASLKVMACYNSLMAELSRDELDIESIEYFLTKIKAQKQIL